MAKTGKKSRPRSRSQKRIESKKRTGNVRFSIASNELELRRIERATEELRLKWWWFDPVNKRHIHQFSVAWEILRRTQVFRALNYRMREIRSAVERTRQQPVVRLA